MHYITLHEQFCDVRVQTFAMKHIASKIEKFTHNWKQFPKVFNRMIFIYPLFSHGIID